MIPDGLELGSCRMCGQQIGTAIGVVVEPAVSPDSITSPRGLVAMHRDCALRLYTEHGKGRLHYTMGSAARVFLELRERASA